MNFGSGLLCPRPQSILPAGCSPPDTLPLKDTCVAPSFCQLHGRRCERAGETPGVGGGCRTGGLCSPHRLRGGRTRPVCFGVFQPLCYTCSCILCSQGHFQKFPKQPPSRPRSLPRRLCRNLRCFMPLFSGELSILWVRSFINRATSKHSFLCVARLLILQIVS